MTKTFGSIEKLIINKSDDIVGSYYERDYGASHCKKVNYILTEVRANIRREFRKNWIPRELYNDLKEEIYSLQSQIKKLETQVSNNLTI